jgi:type III pantothenate kinase
VNLLLDIGNTRVKWAWERGGKLSGAGGVDHGGAPEAALPDAKPDAAWIAQVFGPEREAQIAAAVEARYGIVPQFARCRAQHLGLTVAYADPQRLGVDRWLMMLALWRELGAAFCVVGAGTALTLDGVDAQGRHLGGFIAAGLSTHLSAILGATRFATSDVSDGFGLGLGRDTDSCVRQGALLACAGAVDRGWAAAGAPAGCYLAGGDATRLAPLLGAAWRQRPLLVLEGLAVLATSPAA